MERSEQELRRLEELDLLEKAGIVAYPYSFEKTHDAKTILEEYSDDNPEKFQNVSVAGRIMTIRRMGKASFFHILDASGKIQIYIKRDDVPELRKLQIVGYWRYCWHKRFCF